MDKTCERRERIEGGDGRDDRRDLSGTTTYVFPPRKVVEAVAYHLVDEGLAARVCPRSVERVAERVRRVGAAVVISRALWQTMGNRQRLEWLLASSFTDFRVGATDGTAVLMDAAAK
jgi:hypothetical protein